MSEVGQEALPINPSVVEIHNSIEALHHEMIIENREENALRERDIRVGQRTKNLVSVFKHHYELPEILLVYPGSKATEKVLKLLGGPEPEAEKPPVYLVTSTNQLVSGDFVPGFLGIRKPKINNQRRINADGHWDFYGSLIERGLIKLVPGLKEELRKLDQQTNE